jgi:leader peptidase (prepilin peptidase)/N-methyltransferase
MNPETIAALIGLVHAPLLHTWAVAVGANRPWRPTWRGVWWRIALTALTVAVAYGLMTKTLGVSLVLVAHLAMVSLTTLLVITDFDHFRIPNRLLYPGGLICALLLTVAALVEERSAQLLPAVIGAAAYFGLLLLVFLLARGEGFGFGDVKLAALLGFFAGFHSLRVLAYALFITSLIGGVPALVLLLMGRSRRTAIPYGPPLIFGTWAAIIWAPALLA